MARPIFGNTVGTPMNPELFKGSGTTVDLSNYHTKEEIIELLKQFYDKGEIDGSMQALNEYLSFCVTKKEVETLVQQNIDLSNYYTKEEIETAMLSLGEYLGNFYTKDEVDNKLENSAGSGGVSSWNDLEDKPFFEEITIGDELFNKSITLSGSREASCGYNDFLNELLVVGTTYNVIVDGVSYMCECKSFKPSDKNDVWRYLGNTHYITNYVYGKSYEDNGEPFGIGSYGTQMSAYMTFPISMKGQTIKLEIYEANVSCKQLEPKYIPTDYIKEVIDEVINEALNGEV